MTKTRAILDAIISIPKTRVEMKPGGPEGSNMTPNASRCEMARLSNLVSVDAKEAWKGVR
jgi:hypothetical protein